MATRQVATTCPYCGVGCGVIADRTSDGTVSVRGDASHPANLGRLCSKGAALAETLDLDDRLLYPEIVGQRVDWTAALDTVAEGFKQVIARHGPQAVAFYVSGQLLTEDYYVANKLMKGFIGGSHIDTNSRLCMASPVAAYKRAFGADTVPCSYTDLEQANLIVLVGSNTAWCHPVVFQRIRQAREQRAKGDKLTIVVIDPRRTSTCDIADLHLALKPGADAVLFNGLLNYLRLEDALDWDFLENHTEGFAATLKAAKAAGNIMEVARTCGLDPDEIGRFFRLFARTERTVTLFSQGINQSASGTDKGNAIINCHLATGRIGRPGMGPFSITGQPNAMGGREVGGLANTLAAHMEYIPEHIDRVGRFWQSPGMAQAPGLKAVELFQAIGDRKIKAVWIMATNPVVSLPDADAARAALKRCEFIVVSDCVRHTDTTALAHVLLPASAWGEKSGTVTNSERRISRVRTFLDPPGEARPDWWIITQVAHRMGFANTFAYQTPAAIFREHARLSGFENNGTRDFDINELGTLSDAEYHALAPIQWPVNDQYPNGCEHIFALRRFFTPSGRARLVPITPQAPAHATSDDFPLILNTGRIRDQWHTMTRTGKTARLTAHLPEPLLDIHPEDAIRYQVQPGGLVRVTSRWGEVTVRVNTTDTQLRGNVFVPIHWSDQFASSARIDVVVNPVTDPISGEPEFKHTPVRVTPFKAAWYGFVLAREPLDLPDIEYWVIVRGTRFWRYELAGTQPVPDWSAWSRALLGDYADWIELTDRAAGRFRAAAIMDGQMAACVFIGRAFTLPARTWLADLFAKDSLDPADRLSILTGRPAPGQVDSGPTVCACFSVGRNTIAEAIRAHHLKTPEEIGTHLNAGTNCGSCIPELKRLLAGR